MMIAEPRQTKRNRKQMPESLFKQLALVPLRRPSVLDRLREQIIGNLPAYARHGPTHASTCYVWPSSECPVGCGHCNYASPVSLERLTRYSVARDPDPVLRLMNSMGLWKAVLSGGGEPMVEPEFCELFVNRIDSPNLAEIELITAAHFATGEASTDQALRRLVDAWRTRSAGLAKANFAVRISLDWFHAQRIGVGPAANVIRRLSEPDMNDVGCYIRSVLLDNDSTMADLAEMLGGELTELKDYQHEIVIPGGRTILVYYKNLIVEGRMNQRKLSRLPIGLPTASRADVFGKRFVDDSGKHVPARTYNGPTVRHLDGLACLITDDGLARILEGNDPNRCADVRELDSWPHAVAYLYADPITVYLVDNGPQLLAGLMADAFPDSATMAADTNQLYHLTELLLASPERRMYAMLRALELHVDEGRVTVDQALVDRAWRALAQEGVAVPDRRRPG